MDVNSTIFQTPSPTAASPAEGAAPRPQEGKPPSAGGTKKTFASTLRTVQQGENKGRPQQSDDVESRWAAKPDTRIDQGNRVRDDAARENEIEGPGLKDEADRSSQNHIADSGDGETKDGGEEQPSVFAVPVEVLGPLGQTVPVQHSPEPLTNLPQGAIEEELLASSQQNGMTGASAIPVVVSSLTEAPVTAPETLERAVVPPLGESASGAKQSQAASDAQPLRGTTESPSRQPLNPTAGPVLEAADHESGEQGGTPAQQRQNEKQAASVQPTPEGGKQVSAVSQELSRLDTAGPQLTRLVEQPVQQKQVDVAAHPHRELPPPLPSPEAGGEERAGKSTAIEPHGLRALSDSGQHSDVLWSDQNEGQFASEKHPWAAHAPMASSESDLPDDQSAQSVIAGNTPSPQSRPVDSRSASPAGSAASVSPAHDIEPYIPTMSRSVVFEIAEPDLGRINIRVALANELVHAYLSPDRSEVGQFLMSGQDRLQAALQSNGLEMGQFRVDIDRQSAGRPFQQGSSQDQSRTWQQAPNGSPPETGFFERQNETSLSYAGRLNLVA